MSFAKYVQEMVDTLGADEALSFIQKHIASLKIADPDTASVAPVAAAPLASPPVADVPIKMDKRKHNGSKSNFLNDDFQKMCDDEVIPLGTEVFFKPLKRGTTVYIGVIGTRSLPGGKKEYYINSGSMSSASPSGFASSCRKHFNPDKSPAIDGWANVKIKSADGKSLNDARQLWKAGKAEEAKAVFV